MLDRNPSDAQLQSSALGFEVLGLVPQHEYFAVQELVMPKSPQFVAPPPGTGPQMHKVSPCPDVVS